MSTGHWVIELAQKSWLDLSEDERKVFEEWLRTAEGRDLYLLVRYAMSFRKRSSSQKVAVPDLKDE
jgi:hypothetical protein